MEKDTNASQTPKKNFVDNILNELTKNNVPQKIISPCLEYVEQFARPYYATHIIFQIVIVILLVAVLYKLWQQK